MPPLWSVARSVDGATPFAAFSVVTPKRSRIVRSYCEPVRRGICDVGATSGVHVGGEMGSAGAGGVLGGSGLPVPVGAVPGSPADDGGVVGFPVPVVGGVDGLPGFVVPPGGVLVLGFCPGLLGPGLGPPISPGGSAISPVQPTNSVAATKIALFQVYIALTSQVLVRSEGQCNGARPGFLQTTPLGEPSPALRN